MSPSTSSSIIVIGLPDAKARTVAKRFLREGKCLSLALPALSNNTDSQAGFEGLQPESSAETLRGLRSGDARL